MPTAPRASDGIVRRKYGNSTPLLRDGLEDAGEMIGTREPPATWAAGTEAPEHPAPMMAWTPW
eukprot:7138897-Prymnesium_polylepis.3